MLHTLSHGLIKEFSKVSGYASPSERKITLIIMMIIWNINLCYRYRQKGHLVVYVG